MPTHSVQALSYGPKSADSGWFHETEVEAMADAVTSTWMGLKYVYLTLNIWCALVPFLLGRPSRSDRSCCRSGVGEVV